MYSLTLEALARQKPALAVMAIEKAIQKSGSWITDHTSFSNDFRNFVIESELHKLDILYRELQSAGLEFVEYSADQVKELLKKGKPGLELKISLNVRLAYVPRDIDELDQPA